MCLDRDLMSSFLHQAEWFTLISHWETHLGKCLFPLSPLLTALGWFCHGGSCPDPVLTPALTPSLLPIHAKPQHRPSWLELRVVCLNSAHCCYWVSDCVLIQDGVSRKV